MGLLDSPARGARPARLLLFACLLAAGLAAWFLWWRLGGSPATEAAADLTINLDCPVEAAVGDTTFYQYTISNSGTETLYRVSVTDDLFGDITSKFPGSLSPSQSDTAGMLRNVLESDPRPLPDTVTATYETAGGSQVTATAACTMDVLHLTVVKKASLSAGVFTFEYTITNDGSTPLTLIGVLDSTIGSITAYFPTQLAIGQTETVIITKPQLPSDPLCNRVEATYGHFLPGSVTAVKGIAKACVEEKGSVTLAKYKQVGEFTKPTLVCFQLEVKVDGFVPSPDPPEGAEQCKPPDAAGNATFTWTNLPPGDYRIVETREVCEVKGVVEDPCTRYDPVGPIPFTMPDPPQAIDLGQVENRFESAKRITKQNADGTLWTGPDVTFHICAGSVPTCDPTSPTFERSVVIPRDGNPVRLPEPEGTYTVCEVPPPNFTVEPSKCQTKDVLAGMTTDFVFKNIPAVGEGCTPGFWKQKQHLPRWAEAGVDPYADFDTFFGVDAFDPDKTLFQVVNTKGRKGETLLILAPHLVAAVLNANHPDVAYAYTEAEIIAMFQVAFSNDDKMADLKNELAAENEAGCPLN